MKVATSASNMLVKQPSLIKSTCAYCGVGCGVDISVKDNIASNITGSIDHPANFGKLCVKGSNLLKTTDLTGRLLVPQINNKAVNWDKATDYVASKLNDVIKKHGKDSVAFYVSGQLLTEDYYVANKLMKGYIGSGNIDTNSRLCMSSAVSAYKRAFGEDVVPCDYTDLECTDLLLLTGSNAAWTHPVLYQRIERAKKIKPAMKAVVIDPRKTATCELADHFLAIKPGTDAAFFSGLLCYLDENEGIDHNYIEQHCEGFEETIATVKKWTITEVAQYCDLPVEEIKSVYKAFCQAEKAVTFYSMGINQSSSGVDKCQSIINCHLASGKIGREGCSPFSITGQPNAMGGREVGGLANQLAAHMDIENPEHQEKVQRFWQSPTISTKQGAKAVDLFDKVASGDIKAVWIMATNPMVSLPHREKIKKALSQCELVIVSDCVDSNDTLDFADVKLPATPWLEKNGTVTNSERRISRQRNVLPPAGQAKHDWKIICDVAQRMGFTGFEFNHVSDIFKEHAALSAFENDDERQFNLAGLSNLSQKDYDELSPIQWPVKEKNTENANRVFFDGRFSTPSGKAQFVAITPQLPITQPCTRFDLVLNSGRLRDQWHTMTRTGKAAELSAHTDKPYLYIHPEDARTRSIQNDNLIAVTAKTGQVIVHAKIDENQRLGECFMPIHWNKEFASHANVSELYQSIVDPISGQAESKQSAISVKKMNYSSYVNVHIDTFVDANIEQKTLMSPVHTDLINNNLQYRVSQTADFWIKSTTSYGKNYQVAVKESIDDPLLWCKNVSGLSGEWMYFNHKSTSYIICLSTGKLTFLAYFSDNWLDIESQWLSHVFSQESISFATIQSLLLGIASEDFCQGKQVCSCYKVGEKKIITAIEQGCHSVDDLGRSLKCGTKCGSCKPELANMIKQHALTINTKVKLSV